MGFVVGEMKVTDIFIGYLDKLMGIKKTYRQTDMLIRYVVSSKSPVLSLEIEV